ncbi:MAG: MMPL family transporter [Actinomycetota bacterium]|nr:MMPL family transporter [Actinomycetota bacterium]
MDKSNLAARAAHWSANHRKTAIFGWLAFVVIAVVVGNAVGQKQIQEADRFSGESHQAEEALYDSGLRPNTENVLFQDDVLTIQDPEYQLAIEQASERLARTEDVENVISPLSGGDVPVSEDGHSALIEFEITGDELEAADRIEPSQDAINSVAADHPEIETIEQFGSVSSNKELNETFEEDLLKAEQLSLPITLLILVFAFGSLVAALVPLVLGVTAVMAAMALVAIPSHLSPVDGNISSVILLVGLAVGVDYSLFYIRREREERAKGRDPKSALDVAAATSGRAVLISGLTVIAAMAGMFFTGDKTFISFAEGTILVVAIAIIASLTVLPAILAWLGDRIEKGRVPFIRRRGRAGESRFWSGVVNRVMRRPWLSFVLAGGLLIVLALPALNLKIVQTSTDDLPQDLGVIKTYNKLRAAFPAEGVTVDVAVEANNVRDVQTAAGISLLQRRAESSDNVIGPTEVTYSEDNTVAEVSIPTVGNGNDEESTAALNEIRDEAIPAALGNVAGVTVNVSGNAAASEDFRELVNNRLPLIFAFVFSLAFLLMLFTFRSIVIPIKAIILNMLSVGAAYGILVFLFQDGHGENLLGFTSNGGITSWLPLFLFVLLFGLSMDYHIFILSRVRELVDRGMSTDEAVRVGISSTAGTVTSAAIVMVFVFAVFATLSFLDFKEMGIGLATAVLIDATIIRGVLLPASMKLLGDWNWYLPKWLQWIPEFEHEPIPEPAGSAKAKA